MAGGERYENWLGSNQGHTLQAKVFALVALWRTHHPVIRLVSVGHVADRYGWQLPRAFLKCDLD